MKCITKKSLLTALIVAILALACAFSVIHYGKIAFADAQTTPSSIEVDISDMTEANTTTYVENPGFGVLDQAEIRVATEGIKFKTEITETYYNGLVAEGNTVEFIAVAKNLTTNMSVAVKFANKPEFTDDENANETFVLNTYFNFDNLGSADKAAVYAMDFTTETYAKVTEGSSVSYFKAFDPVTVTRSMRAVANAAVLNYVDEDTDGFDINDLNPDYFTEGARISEIYGYTLADGIIYFSLPEEYTAPNDGAEIKAYYNAKPVTATYDADTQRYTVTGLASTLSAVSKNTVSYISVFGDNNTVYSTKAAQATALTQQNFTDLQSAEDGVYVITEDITLTETWTPTRVSDTNYLTATIDGLNHSVSGLKTNANYHGLVGYFKGDIKNLTVNTTGDSGNHSSALIGFAKGDTLVENVIVNIDFIKNYSYGGLYRRNDGNATIRNTIVYADMMGTSGTQGLICAQIANSGSVTFDNVYLGNPSHTLSLVAGAQYEGTTKTLGDLYTIRQEDKDSGLSKAMLDDFDSLKIIKTLAQENITDILMDGTVGKDTTGYFVLTEDVDMSIVDVNGDKTVNSSDKWLPVESVVFYGTLDGLGHSIKNFTTSGTSYTSFFRRMYGAIKNLNIDTTLNGSNTSGLIGQVKMYNSASTQIYDPYKGTTGVASVENVVININKMANSGSGGVCTWVETGTLAMKDVFVNSNEFVEDTKEGLFTGYVASVSYENVKGIGNTTTIHGNPAGTLKQTGEPVIYEDVATFLGSNEDETLVERMKSLDVFLDNTNIEKLQTITNGYVYLIEDVDMAYVDLNRDGTLSTSGSNYTDKWTYAKTTTFAGTFNGLGHSIKNFRTSSSWNGFFNYVGAGATVKNFALQFAYASAHAPLIGQVKGATTIENVVVAYSELGGSNSAGFATVIQGVLTIKNSLTYYTGKSSNVNADNCGWFASDNAISSYIIVDNVYTVCENASITTPFAGADKPAEGETAAVIKTRKTDGETLAEKDVDYYVYTTAKGFYDAAYAQESTIPTTLVTLAEKAGVIGKYTQDNIETLQGATMGYHALADNVSLSGVKYKPIGYSFLGTFDGSGYKISDFNVAWGHSQAVGLFSRFCGTIKNLAVHVTAIGNNHGSLAYIINGATTIENVYIEYDRISTSGGGGLFAVTQGAVTINNVLLNIKSISSGTNMGILSGASSDAGNITANNLFIVNPSIGTEIPFTTLFSGKNGGKVIGTENTNYWMSADVADFPQENMSDTLKTLLPEGFLTVA